jgi:heptose I phosphotransferase
VTERYLREDLAEALGDRDLLAWAEAIANAAPPETIYRHKEGRRTLRFEQGGSSFFLKLHTGVGWLEILKNLLQLRLPIVSARNEYAAIRALEAIGVDTMTVAAFAERGANPAHRLSMLVTDDLVGTVSLEDFCADWASNPPPAALRMRLVRTLATIARRMHGAGINHRDFYLCHFHLDLSSLDSPRPRCHVIDLHRAQQRAAVPRRWLVKDLAGLYFSAMDCGLTRRDLLRFLRHYEPDGLRAALGNRAGFWQSVEGRAQKLYRRERGVAPPLPAGGRA